MKQGSSARAFAADGRDKPGSTGRGREFVFTVQDFRYIQQLVGEVAGISLSEAKQDLVYSRLCKRLRALGLTSFRQYCEYVRHDATRELSHLINAITTNLTAFFREQHHFDFLAESLLPELVTRKGNERQIRVWSAGCSSGEEPYSLAITLLERLPAPERWDIKILATDLDSNMLERAGQGVYPESRLEGVPTELARRWFLRGRGQNQGLVRVHPALQELIRFRRLNLMDAWPMQKPFDLIFCRNVMIYFDKPTQGRLVERYCSQLVPEGHLFIGHSESLFGINQRLQLVGKTVYRKTAAGCGQLR